MKRILVVKWTVMSFLALVLLMPGWAAAQTTYGRIVVFGDSLSDPGNAYILKGGENTPPYNDPAKLDELLIPDVPYATGGHHFSNGATWVEQLARPMGLAGNARPGFQGSISEANNYAVGGARAHEDGTHVNLATQVNTFLNAVGGTAPSDALYVVEFGGNDLRDALATGSPEGATAIITEALGAIGNNIGVLYMSGARKFLIWNAPNLGLTPAIRTLDYLYPGAAQSAGYLTQAFNSNLDGLLGMLKQQLPGIEFVRFDVYQVLNDLVANPAAYGLSVVNAACIMPDVPPYECGTPDDFLFWDGMHPTQAVHGIIAQGAASALAK